MKEKTTIDNLSNGNRGGAISRRAFLRSACCAAGAYVLGGCSLARVSDATLPGFDCNQKPFVWPLMILGE